MSGLLEELRRVFLPSSLSDSALLAIHSYSEKVRTVTASGMFSSWSSNTYGDKNRAPCNKKAKYTLGKHRIRLTAAMLPHDVLSAIFLAAMTQPSDETAHHNSGVPTTTYLSGTNPLTFSHVCFQWRVAAINMSELWSTICIDHPRRSHVRLTDLWLERARTHPLSLTIKNSRYSPLQPSAFLDVLQLFSNKISQWHDINFEIPLEVVSQLSHILFQRKGQCRQLRSATLSIHSPSTRRIFKLKDHRHLQHLSCIDSIWESIHTSPVLSYANWKSLYEGLPLPVHAPYNTLTKLELDYSVEISDILTILSMCPNMKILRASVGLSNSAGVTKVSVGLHLRTTSHELQPLQSLSITTTENVGMLFERIRLPALRKLHIIYQRTPPIFWEEEKPPSNSRESMALLHFLHRSRCLLEDVWLNKPPYDENDLLSHLRSPSFQTINRLRISGSKLFTDNIIRFCTLRQNDNMDIIMPEIRDLWLDMEDTEITDGLIANMVASRWPLTSGSTKWTRGQAARALKEVHLVRDFSFSFGTMDMKIFSHMQLQGLRISISPGGLTF